MRAIIVDDEPLARNELHYLLNQINHFEKIDEAENVSETLELLLYDDYDVIFLDINLMDESGLDLANKIKKMKHAPFIIFATAHDTFAVKAFELDAIDYILKPFEQQRIAQAVHKVEQALGKLPNIIVIVIQQLLWILKTTKKQKQVKCSLLR